MGQVGLALEAEAEAVDGGGGAGGEELEEAGDVVPRVHDDPEAEELDSDVTDLREESL